MATAITSMSHFKYGFTGPGKDNKDNPQGKGREESKKKYENEKRRRKFFDKWRNDFKWVEHDVEKDVMFCVSCRSRFVVETSNFRIDTLKQHDASKAYISCQLKNEIDLAKQSTSGTVFCSYTGQATHDTSMTEISSASASNQPAVIGPMDICICKLNEGQRQKLIACFNNTYFIAKQELPFTIYPNLLDLLERNCVSLPTSCKTDQACRRFMKYIFDDVMTENHKLLKNSRVSPLCLMVLLMYLSAKMNLSMYGW